MAVGCATVRLSTPFSSSSSATQGVKRGTKPYTVLGKTYYPLQSAAGFRETGVASWYGPNFHGKKTANGETYNMYAMTAAHKILPLGTVVRVSHLNNGKNIIVRVNDRGPFVDDRIIDLSYTAAKQLDMIGTGTARVQIIALSDSSTIASGIFSSKANQSTQSSIPLDTQPRIPSNAQSVINAALNSGKVSSNSGKVYIQIVSLSSHAAANSLAKSFQSMGIGGRTVNVPSQKMWRVQAGPFANTDQARAGLAKIAAKFPDAYIVEE